VYPRKKIVSSGLPTQNCVEQDFGEGVAKFTPDVGILPVLRPPVEPWLLLLPASMSLETLTVEAAYIYSMQSNAACLLTADALSHARLSKHQPNPFLSLIMPGTSCQAEQQQQQTM